MIVLPGLTDYIKPRPHRPKFEQLYLVPDFSNNLDFWNTMKHMLFALDLYSPLEKDVFEYVNPFCGFFGNRLHPVSKEPSYYHLGIELVTDAKSKVRPLLKGVLEYSGYSVVNGYYVLLSHPHIQTEDGYILHTMYCHLKKPLVKFSSYQKMLREISLGSHPIIEINRDTILGLVGSSGAAVGELPKLYLQCDFRKLDKKPIVIDPMNFFSEHVHVNESRKIKKVEKEA